MSLNNEWIFWSLAGAAVALFLIVIYGANGGCRSREPIIFTPFTDPIYPSPPNYLEHIWPRTGGQLGENLFTGWPQYPKAY